MPFIFIDRRKAAGGKSTPNTQKLIRRIKSFVKSSAPGNLGANGLAGKTTSPVKVTSAALEEPFFAYASGGDAVTVYPGNKEYDRGDEIELPEGEGEGQGGNGAGQGGGGEDDFVVNVASRDFYEAFFEDCELPNLTHEKVTEKLDTTQQPDGFSTNGTPAQLSIIRSYRNMIGRRKALTKPYRDELEELEKELECLKDYLKGNITDERRIRVSERIIDLEERIQGLQRKIGASGGFDKVDLRYRKKAPKPLNTVDAVLILIMDISGSMDQNRKDIARRWFALLYAFISKRYPQTLLHFIAHTDEAFEMSEQEFFSTRVNGGTSVSPALRMANKIIKDNYDPEQTNIYVCHASDGDNWFSDNEQVREQMIGAGNLMKKVQFFNYIEVGGGNGWSYNTTSGKSSSSTVLWEAYEGVQDTIGTSKLSLAVLPKGEDVYDVFKKVYKKQPK